MEEIKLVERLCKEFIEKIGDNVDSFEFTPKLKKGLQIPDGVTVFLAHDDTMFHNGKNGFAITDQGIYCKPMSEGLTITSYEELKEKTELTWVEDNNCLLCADQNAVAYYTDGKAVVEEGLMDLFSEMIAGLSGRELSSAPVSSADISEAAPGEQVPEAGEEAAESDASASGEAVKLYMVQKAISLKPKFDIFDENENAVYHVEGDITRLNFSIQRNGAEVLKLKKKLVAIMPEYTIEKASNEIAKIKKKFRLLNPELVGNVNGKELKINGDLWGFDFDVLVGGTVIGHVEKDFGHWSDHYCITSYDLQMQDVLIALAIICDNVSDQEESK